MEIIVSPKALTDLLYWKMSKKVKVQKQIQELISQVVNNSLKNNEQPEALKIPLNGFLCVPITKEHNMIYRILNNCLEITSLKGNFSL